MVTGKANRQYVMSFGSVIERVCLGLDRGRPEPISWKTPLADIKPERFRRVGRAGTSSVVMTSLRTNDQWAFTITETSVSPLVTHEIGIMQNTSQVRRTCRIEYGSRRFAIAALFSLNEPAGSRRQELVISESNQICLRLGISDGESCARILELGGLLEFGFRDGGEVDEKEGENSLVFNAGIGSFLFPDAEQREISLSLSRFSGSFVRGHNFDFLNFKRAFQGASRLIFRNKQGSFLTNPIIQFSF